MSESQRTLPQGLEQQTSWIKVLVGWADLPLPTPLRHRQSPHVCLLWPSAIIENGLMATGSALRPVCVRAAMGFLGNCSDSSGKYCFDSLFSRRQNRNNMAVSGAKFGLNAGKAFLTVAAPPRSPRSEVHPEFSPH